MDFQSGSGSFNERVPFQSFGRDPSVHQAQGDPMDLADLWSIEAPACGSPLSTSSSISHAESMHSPPYTGLPVYDTLEPAFPNTQASLENNGTCTSGSEALWACNYSEAAPWDSQPFVMPFQNVPSYEQPPLELTQGFQSQPQGVAPAPYLPYTESLPYPMEQDVESPTVNAEASGSNEHGRNDLSDSDSDDSWCDDSDSSPPSSRAFSRRPQGRANVFRVEGWSTNMCPFNATPDRKNLGPTETYPAQSGFNDQSTCVVISELSTA
ncbi:hypothetical protein yc1106_07431 [Curvularia clavata]|uniref:Uncharacterized protein n=1 Tax=Curvularia clavata TaxID=95742 RepID=A0A9Q8ZBL2_CURCL|nr:hypothetical protein yc1106_07431 [Curvularia clavata]